MKEIVTIQLGGDANRLGAYFWRLQESYFTYSASDEILIDHDVHFVEGVGKSGPTFLPRLIAYGDKQTLGTYRHEEYPAGNVDDIEEGLLPSIEKFDATAYNKEVDRKDKEIADSALDNGKQNQQTLTTRSRKDSNIQDVNEFHSLTSLVSNIHPKSLNMEFTLSPDQIDEEIRPWFESSDNIQALQIQVSSAYNEGASEMLPMLRDSFGTKLVIPIYSIERLPSHRSREALSLCNLLLSAQEHSDLYLPLRTNTLIQSWESERNLPDLSAHALALESIFIPSRAKKNSVNFFSLLEGVTTISSRILTQLKFMPAGIDDSMPLSWISNAKTTPWAQIITSRPTESQVNEYSRTTKTYVFPRGSNLEYMPSKTSQYNDEEILESQTILDSKPVDKELRILYDASIRFAEAEEREQYSSNMSDLINAYSEEKDDWFD